jgi:hypothetical protein
MVRTRRKRVEGRPNALPKVADPERLVSIARLEPEGPERNLLTTGSQIIGGRQGYSGGIPDGPPERPQG